MILANQHPHTASWPLELALGDVGEDSVGGGDIVLTGSVGDAVQAQHDTLPLGALHVECEAVVGELHHLGILPSEHHELPGVTGSESHLDSQVILHDGGGGAIVEENGGMDVVLDVDQLDGEHHVLVKEGPEVILNSFSENLRAGEALLDQVPEFCLATVENVVMKLTTGFAIVVRNSAVPVFLGAATLFGFMTAGEAADTEIIVHHELGLLLQVPAVHEGLAV